MDRRRSRKRQRRPTTETVVRRRPPNRRWGDAGDRRWWVSVGRPSSTVAGQFPGRTAAKTRKATRARRSAVESWASPAAKVRKKCRGADAGATGVYSGEAQGVLSTCPSTDRHIYNGCMMRFVANCMKKYFILSPTTFHVRYAFVR